MKNFMPLVIPILAFVCFHNAAQAQVLFSAAVQQRCSEFKTTLNADKATGRIIEFGTLQVPLTYRAKNSLSAAGRTSTPIFFWRKKGIDSTKPPLLLLHGGVGQNSMTYYSLYKDSSYPGDVVSLDLRNEGCSNRQPLTMNPAVYAPFVSRNAVKDLELLRDRLYGNATKTKWRVFGQSRGSVIGQYYLEMFPNALESLYVHGWALMQPQNAGRYDEMRVLAFVDASERFFNEDAFNQGASLIRQARAYFEANKDKAEGCVALRFGQGDPLPDGARPQVCGSTVVDALGWKLSNYTRRKDLVKAIVQGLSSDDGATFDPAKARSFFATEANMNIYTANMNYILGTNSVDMGSFSPEKLESLVQLPSVKEALLTEIRFAQAVYTEYLKMGFPKVKGDFDPYDFAKVRRFLSNYAAKNLGSKFKLVYFKSKFDPLAPAKMYEDVTEAFANHGLAEVIQLNQSGHEGWQTEPVLRERLLLD